MFLHVYNYKIICYSSFEVEEMSVSENIKNLRKQRNMTQKQLAAQTGLAVITIQQYEAGKYVPKIEALKKIAVALECEVSDIDESIIVIPLPKYELTPERLEKARLHAEAEKLIQKKSSDENITADEQKKIDDYIERIKNSFARLPERTKEIKNKIDKIGENILLADYRELNTDGQAEARKRVSELTEIPRYTQPDLPQS
jgi:transcriptional regulator with XRE-family HTH domain